MAKRARQKISYVLELAGSSSGGHRLGVNGLAVDRDNSILYSGGRDGVVCAWDLNLDLSPRAESAVVDSTTDGAGPKQPKPKTTFRTQTQAHTHWVNDIVLVQDHRALVSGSSDLTVKVWRPHGEEVSGSGGASGGVDGTAAEWGGAEPVTLGEHADYVRCVASPGQWAPWVASGGLDRKVCIWDLSGAGKTLELDVRGEEKPEKGSVYGLAAHRSMVANGGPEASVRLWDPRTGKRITKFVGHTDNIRAILISEQGDAVLTASSDQTVKVWSVTAGRCMYTMTMHSDSVWSLFSERPDLSVFYSSDRGGLVAKTDVRAAPGGGTASLADLDDGVCLAIAQETQSVGKVVACAGHIWTATASSSINRWADVDVAAADALLPEPFRGAHHRVPSSTSTRSKPASVSPATAPTNGHARPPPKDLSAKSVLRISHTATFPAQLMLGGGGGGGVAGGGPRGDLDAASLGPTSMVRKGSESLFASAADGAMAPAVEPVHHLPEETIEGQFGLVKHKLLNDRRRVLTLDTAGDVLLWDLIKCVPTQSFGKKHLEDVEPIVNTREAVAPWCSIDTSVGNLTVVLDSFNCFDAEMYADELVLDEPVEFREDQRINLGKWILRYLFANLIDEEIKRDEAYRHKLNEAVEKRLSGGASRANRPSSIQLPASITLAGWETGSESSPVTTPRANGAHFPPMTPGMAIGLATPAIPTTASGPRLAGVPEDGVASPTSPPDKRLSQVSRPSVDTEDYFSTAIMSADGPKAAAGAAAVTSPAPQAEAAADEKAKTPAAEAAKDKDKDKDATANGKSPSTPFSKKFRMGMSFSSKKLSRSASTTGGDKVPAVDEKAEDNSESSSSNPDEREVDDSLGGVAQRMRNEYDKLLAAEPDRHVESKVAPSLPNDTPVLKLPPNTKIIIQEETSGGSANLYRGTVASVGRDADAVEQRAAMWLGEVLLLNQIPQKEPVKVSFVLQPFGESLPPITTADGNNRLNANRMLRVKKILSYVAERIDPAPEDPDPDALKPEEYLELYCNSELLPNTMSLATLRAHVWKGGNDIMLYYKANGRKEIANPPLVTTPAAAAAGPPTAGDPEAVAAVTVAGAAGA